MKRVAIIGGGGYVGGHVCEALRRRGHEVVAIGRPHSRIALERLGVRVVGRAAEAGRADVVLNLAFPTAGSVYSHPAQNRALLDDMRSLGGDRARVVHVSTMAVFGFDLSVQPRLGPVESRRDHLYIESKIHLERLVWKSWRDRDAHIVRLGNVWGPGSPNWTASLAQALLFGLPVGVRGADGYSNVTDVANAADFLAALTDMQPVPTIQFHHLAEHSATPWSHWVELLARALAVDPLRTSYAPAPASSLRSELRELMAPASPMALWRRAVYGRYTGSWLRSLVRMVPPVVFQAGKRRAGRGRAASLLRSEGDALLLGILTCPGQFASQTNLSWTPPVDLTESWRRVDAWLDQAGYREAPRYRTT